ncbi:MAG: hypothetical protein GY940_45755, partial [bacterium]|nr:hypothetical protein [bacterium]
MGPNSKIKTGSPVRSPRTLNSWLLFAAIGIIAVVSFFYWFVYIENNRDKQISKRFRVLAQMGQNIYERERILGGSANTAVDIGIQATLDTGLEPDSLHESRHESRLNLIKREIKDAKSLKVDKIDSITKAKVFEMADFSGGKDDELYTIYIRRKDFFAPLERPDVFDELIVLEDKNEQDDTGKMVTNSSVLYDTFPGDLDISNFKQLKTEQDEAGGIGMSTVTIWGKSYKLFLQPLVLDDGRKWYIGGMTGSAKFKRQVQALNSDIIILLLMGFLIFLFSIPLLKLYLMRTFDQLDRFDALLTSVSVVGCTLLLILFNMILYQNYHDNRIIDSNLQGLGQKVQENFIEELNDAYKTLEKFNNETKPDLRAYDKVTNLLSHPQLKNTLPKNTIPETIGFEDAKEPGFDAKSLALDKAYNLFKIVFWMDDTGQQIALLTTRNDSGSFSALGHRSYFKDAGNWVLPPDPKHPLGPTEEERGFMLESITSITSGEKLAAISMKSTAEFPGTDVSPTGEKIGAKRSRAAAMTTQLTSVIDTVMPVGYGFCIIDETGKVWFHSNTEQNLQENFIREVGEDSQLISAVQGHRKRDLTLNYQSKRHRCRVIPLEDIPLFLVVFHDTAYTESSQVGTILNTSFFMMTLIFFTSLIFLAIGVFNYNKSLLKQRYIYFDWLRPQITADSKGTYIHLSTSNGLIILFLLIFNFSAGRFETLFLCLSALLFSFTYNYYTMARLHDSANKMTAKRFRLNDKRLLVFLSIFLLLIDFIALVILKLPALLLVVSQVTILACLFLMKQSKAKPEPLRVQSDPGVETVKTTAQWYSFFLFSWLAVTYIVPMLMIYNHAYNDESEIARKYSQVKLAQDIQQRNDAIDKFYNERMDPEGESTSPPKKTGKDGKNEETLLDNTRKRRKERGIYSNPVGDVYCKNQTHVKDKFQSASTISPAVFNDADYYLRVPYDPIAREKRNLVYPNASDHSRTWKKMDGKPSLKYKVENSPNNRQAGHDPAT